MLMQRDLSSDSCRAEPSLPGYDLDVEAWAHVLYISISSPPSERYGV